MRIFFYSMTWITLKFPRFEVCRPLYAVPIDREREAPLTLRFPFFCRGPAA